MQAILPTEPLDRDDVEEMERRFAFYLEMCAQWDMKVGNMAAYAAIGIDKADAYEWCLPPVLLQSFRGSVLRTVRYKEG